MHGLAKAVLVLLCTVLLPKAEAEVYRWVDGTGKTQYSDAPPPSRPARIEVVNTAPPAEGVRPTDWEEKEREFRRRQATQQAVKPAAEAEKACADARRVLQEWHNNEGRRVFRTNKDGERVYVSDDERPTLKAAAEQAVQTRCRR